MNEEQLNIELSWLVNELNKDNKDRDFIEKQIKKIKQILIDLEMEV